jgi:dihydrofolate reductase
VFVLTHHAREPLEMQGGTTFTFVTDGIESALEQARAAAGDRDVLLAGGGETAARYLRAGLLDEFQLHVVPILLGDGVRLFSDHVGTAPASLERTRVVESPTGVTHLRYRVPR